MYYLFSIFIFQEFGPVNKLCSGTRRLFSTLCSETAPTTEHVYVPNQRSWTCRLVSTLCSKTVTTTEHVYILNHARGLVHQSLRRARGLCRPPSTFTFPTMLGDWSTSLYAMLGDCADHRARLHFQLCSGTHQSLPALCSGLA